VIKHAAELKKKVSDVEWFIKRNLATHMPSCMDAEPDDDTATCPEHCRACAFGTADGDGSRPAACTREHTLRCVECATAHSLPFDFGVLLESARNMLVRAEAAADAAATARQVGGGAGTVAAAANAAAAAAAQQDEVERTDWQQQVEEKKATFEELQKLIQRALLKIRAFHAHERRAAHEAKVLEMLLRELKEDGCIVIADWKARALTHTQPSAMPCQVTHTHSQTSHVAARLCVLGGR
jgi:hypothetical protein